MFALKAIGNMVAIDDTELTERVLSAAILPLYAALVASSNDDIGYEICWSLSNIASGGQRHAMAIVETPGLIPELLFKATTGTTVVRNEAMWALTNIAFQGDFAVLPCLMCTGAMVVLADGVLQAPQELQVATLKAVQAILACDRNVHLHLHADLNVKTWVIEAGWVSVLPTLEETAHIAPCVAALATSILEKYFR